MKFGANGSAWVRGTVNARSCPVTYKVRVGEAALNKHVDHVKAENSQMGQEQSIHCLSEPVGSPSTPPPSGVEGTSESEMDMAGVAALTPLPPEEEDEFLPRLPGTRDVLQSTTNHPYLRLSPRKQTQCENAPGPATRERPTSWDLKQVPKNRKGHTAVVFEAQMYVYGGYVDIKGPSQEFWSFSFVRLPLLFMRFSSICSSYYLFSTDAKDWCPVFTPCGDVGPGPRYSHSAAVYRRGMYLFGGLVGFVEQNDFWKWDFSSCVWSRIRA
eukprot:g44328.t1